VSEGFNRKAEGFLDIVGAQIVELSATPRKEADKWLSQYGAYGATKDMLNNVWDNSSAVAGMRRYMNLAAKKLDIPKYEEVIAAHAEILKDAVYRDNEMVLELERSIHNDYGVKKGSARAKEIDNKIQRAMVSTGLIHTVESGLLNELVTGKRTLDELIAKRDKGWYAPEEEQMTELVELYMEGKKGLHNYANLTDSTKRAKMNELVALKGLKYLTEKDGIKPVEFLQDMHKNHNTTFTKMVSSLAALKTMHETIQERYPDTGGMINGNMIMDVPGEPQEIKLVSAKDLQKGKYHKEGWEVLREPTKGVPGLVYRVETKGGQTGIGLQANLATAGLEVGKHDWRRAGGDKDVVGHDEKTVRVPLTAEEKKILGYDDTPAQSVIRTWSHHKYIMETQKIRQELMGNQIHKVKTTADVKELWAQVKDKNAEHPWILDTSEVDREGFDAETKEQYEWLLKQYEKNGSDNILGEEGNATYIRNDIAKDIVGTKRWQFQDNHLMNKVLNMWMKVVTHQKIQMIILNPLKITLDGISGVTYLSAIGVPWTMMLEESPKIVEGLKDLGKWRNQILALELQKDGLDEKSTRARNIQSKIDGLKSKISKSDYGFALEYGLVQSMSTEITLKNYDTVSGLDHDIKGIISKLTRDKSGDLSGIGKNIMKMANGGPDFTKALSGPASVMPEGGMKDLLESMATNINKSKSDEDIETYLANFLGGPSSEFVKLGSALTHYTDVIPRVIGVKYLVTQGAEVFEKEKGRKPNKTEYDAIVQDAVSNMLRAYGNYNENMPAPVQMLSNLYFMMFPSYWTRQIRVDIDLARKRMLGLAQLMAMPKDFTVLGASIPVKYVENTMINAPSPGDVVLPYGHFVPGL